MYTSYSKWKLFDDLHIVNGDGFMDVKWKLHKNEVSKIGATVWFKCTYYPDVCPRLSVKIDNYQQGKCHVSIGMDPHNHEYVVERITYWISQATKDIIFDFEKGFKLYPSQMLLALRDKTPKIPNLIQQISKRYSKVWKWT